MKRILFFMSALGTLLLAGCTREKFGQSGEGDGDEQTRYLSVNIVSSDADGTRAAVNGGYEYGSETENKVNNVRFYFFNEDGSLAKVKRLGATYVNYYDWTPNGQTGGTDPNVESILSATLVIDTKSGDQLPYSMAAVLNPTDAFKKKNYYSLVQLQSQQEDYADSKYTTEGKFVMFNSVYGNDDDNTEVCAVIIEPDNLQPSRDAAQDHPVTIHVERCVAKVRVRLGENTADAADPSKLLALKDKIGKDLFVNDKQVYLKLDGWNLTAESSRSRLVKRINPKWTMSWWNKPDDFRSCWAINSSDAKNRYLLNYNSESYKSFGVSALYTNENAADFEEDKLERTKFILKGRLCDKDGNNFTIIRHMGFLLADKRDVKEADNLPVLKASILSQFKNNKNNIQLFYKTSNGREEIGVNDIKIVFADQQKVEESKNNCYVYAQLTDEAKNRAWYTSDQSTTEITGAVVNGYLKNPEYVDWALVWSEGMTYYYHDIIHNGSTPGVVRNHIYDVTVTSIVGLGTPVYDPTLIIYPEKPDENDHYIAAQVNILAWDLVLNDYKLEW